MRIAMLVLITLGYYGLLFFLNKRRKTAFEKKAVSALGDTINLDATEDATGTDLFGEVNNNVDSDTLSELTSLLDVDNVLESNMTNLIDDIEAVAPAPSTLPIKEIGVQGLDNQDAIIEESDIDGLMPEIISKQE